MKPLLYLITVFTLTMPHPVHRDIFILYVQPAGETFTLDEQQTAYQYAREAADYWMQLSPISTTITITGSAVITTTENVLDDPYSLIWSAAIPNNVLPVVVIDNSESRRALYSNTILGMGYPNVVLLLSEDGPDVYAHEFGHSFYGLLDTLELYDIMNSFPMLAYDRHMIGCASLAELGKPCTSVFIPMVTR